MKGKRAVVRGAVKGLGVQAGARRGDGLGEHHGGRDFEALLDGGLWVRTPEGALVSAVLADPIARMWALVVDLLVMFGVLLGCLMLVVSFRNQATLGVVFVLVFVVSWGYFFLLEFFWRGQSLGKRLLGLQVVSEDLSALRLSQCAWRNVLRYLDFLPGCFGLGLCCMLLNGRNQRLGDWMAGTVVIVREGRGAGENGLAAMRRLLDSGGAVKPSVALSSLEREAVVGFALYAQEHSLARAVELSEPLAGFFVGVEPECRVERLMEWGRWCVLQVDEVGFVREHEGLWQDLQGFLMGNREAGLAAVAFPWAYRQVCGHLALARARGLSAGLVGRLNDLVVLGRRRLYAERARGVGGIADFFLLGLPRALRDCWVYVALAGGLFVLPLGLGLAVGLWCPEYAQSVGGEYEQMYEPVAQGRVGESRGAESDVLMWGHYVLHNTSIGLRTIVGGVFAGFGSVAVLVSNGWHLGVVSADMLRVGYAWGSFFPFVVGHSAFELSAVVLAGAVGLALARSLFLPTRWARAVAVRRMLARVFALLVVTVGLFFVAAWVEAFWSARVLAPEVKFMVGGVLWALVLGYGVWVWRGGNDVAR